MLAAPERPPLTGDLDVEVCVVGAGLAGLTIARELARRGWSVAVLEARPVAWNASGRNTGFVLPGFAQDMDVVVRRVGLAHAKALWALSEAGVEYVRAHDPRNRHARRRAGRGRLAQGVQDRRCRGRSRAGAAARPGLRRRGRRLAGRARARGAQERALFPRRPLSRTPSTSSRSTMRSGLRRRRRWRARASSRARPALSIDADGVRKRVTTPSARLRAAHVVLAGNVHLGKVMPRVSGTLLPVWTYVATTAPLGAAARRRHRLSRRRERHRPRRQPLPDRRRRPADVVGRHDHVGAQSAPLRARSFKADIEAVYPQLGEVEIEHVWTGVLGNTLHRMPQIGELSPRLWLASGFGGHGLNTTAMAGEMHRARHRRWRRHLAAVPAVRPGLGRRRASAGRSRRCITGGTARASRPGRAMRAARGGVSPQRSERSARHSGGQGGCGFAARTPPAPPERATRRAPSDAVEARPHAERDARPTIPFGPSRAMAGRRLIRTSKRFIPSRR